MFRLLATLIVVNAMLLAGCGQKGPLVLPEKARARPAPPPAHDVPPVQERGR
jgi:predicted small lipoprotein YifL